MGKKLSSSRFDMWRAVIAMIHADGVVTPHELSFINNHLSEFDLSSEQRHVVAHDLQVPQDAYEMFSKIDKDDDKTDFFALARALSWSDGDFDKQEKLILKNLENSHSNEESMRYLSKSRSVMQEVELFKNQWSFKTPRSRELFSFLNKKPAKIS